MKTFYLPLFALGCAASGQASFTQVDPQGSDILWVIDGSGSMAEEQAILASGFVSFINELETDDFRIGVTSMSLDTDGARLLGEPPYLTMSDDFLTLFAERARIGTSGDSKEKGLDVSVRAVTEANPDFMRDDASLLVIYVSDEEDCSDEGRLDGEAPTACYRQADALEPASTYVRRLQDAKPEPLLVTVGAIVGPDPACTDTYFGRRYAQAAYATGGLVGDICAADWSRILGDLGLTTTGGRRSFPVNERAVPGSVQVKVAGEKAEGWIWDEDACSVVFDLSDLPKKGDKVEVSYRVDARAEPCPGTDPVDG